MTKLSRLVALGVGLLLSTIVAPHARAQSLQSGTLKVLRGATLQPVFEGWEENADGTYSFWFGYLNRNWEEELNIPVGPDNNIEPGGRDRGQPEIFQTGEQKRRQMFAFNVVVPADWPIDRDLVWSVTSAETTLKAYASLRPDYMVDVNVISANRGSQRDVDPVNKNAAPVISEAPKDQAVAVGTPLMLEVSVTDDGNPIPVRLSQNLDRQLRVWWLQWRGPGHVKFDPEIVPVTDSAGELSRVGGTASTNATFDRPGTYVLVLYAEDVSHFAMQRVTVTATDSNATPR